MDTATLTIVCASAGFAISNFYLDTKSGERWAALKTESDAHWAKLLESPTDFKNVTIAHRFKPKQ